MKTRLLPTRRQTLNSKQLQILQLLYKFRFGTADLLAQSQDVSRRYMNTRLRILSEQHYIGKNYDGSYKLAGRPAEYYLFKSGIDLLKQDNRFSKQILRNVAKDHDVSERFIEHCVSIFSTFCLLRRTYGDNLKFFTRSNLLNYDYFPKPLPDAYVSFKDGEANKPAHMMLECFDGTMPDFAMKKRVEQIVKHSNSGDWTPNAPYPHVVFICKTKKLQHKVNRWITKVVEDSWDDELIIEASTQDSVVIDIANRQSLASNI